VVTTGFCGISEKNPVGCTAEVGAPNYGNAGGGSAVWVTQKGCGGFRSPGGARLVGLDRVFLGDMRGVEAFWGAFLRRSERITSREAVFRGKNACLFNMNGDNARDGKVEVLYSMPFACIRRSD